MNRRSFLMGLAASAGLIPFVKANTKPVIKYRDYEIPYDDDPVLLSWYRCDPVYSLTGDALTAKETMGRMEFRKGAMTEKECKDWLTRNLIPKVEKGFRRESTSFTWDVYGHECFFRVVDVEESAKRNS